MGGLLASTSTPAATDLSQESATTSRTPDGTVPCSSRSSCAFRTTGQRPGLDMNLTVTRGADRNDSPLGTYAVGSVANLRDGSPERPAKAGGRGARWISRRP